jgi:hypothetical protein
MKFTIAPETLNSLMKTAGISRPRKADQFTLSACDGRVSVAFRGTSAGTVAPISSEGAVKLMAKNFRAMLDAYAGTPELRFEGGPKGLKIENLTVPVQEWIPNPRTS